MPFASISKTWNVIRNVPFIVWLWIAQLFLLIEAPVIVSAEAVNSLRMTLLVYMLAQLMFIGPNILKIKVPGLQMNINQSLPWFVGGFIVTVIAVGGFSKLPSFGIETYSLSAPFYLIIFHAAVVAVSENLVFFGLLSSIVTPYVACPLFGIFHAAAYDLDYIAIFVAIVAGFVFYAIIKVTNIWMSMGVHAGYNVQVIMKIFGMLGR